MTSLDPIPEKSTASMAASEAEKELGIIYGDYRGEPDSSVCYGFGMAGVMLGKAINCIDTSISQLESGEVKLGKQTYQDGFNAFTLASTEVNRNLSKQTADGTAPQFLLSMEEVHSRVEAALFFVLRDDLASARRSLDEALKESAILHQLWKEAIGNGNVKR